MKSTVLCYGLHFFLLKVRQASEGDQLLVGREGWADTPDQTDLHLSQTAAEILKDFRPLYPSPSDDNFYVCFFFNLLYCQGVFVWSNLLSVTFLALAMQATIITFSQFNSPVMLEASFSFRTKAGYCLRLYHPNLYLLSTQTDKGQGSHIAIACK